MTNEIWQSNESTVNVDIARQSGVDSTEMRNNRRRLEHLPNFITTNAGNALILGILSKAQSVGFENSLGHG